MQPYNHIISTSHLLARMRVDNGKSPIVTCWTLRARQQRNGKLQLHSRNDISCEKPARFAKRSSGRHSSFSSFLLNCAFSFLHHKHSRKSYPTSPSHVAASILGPINESCSYSFLIFDRSDPKIPRFSPPTHPSRLKIFPRVPQ